MGEKVRRRIGRPRMPDHLRKKQGGVYLRQETWDALDELSEREGKTPAQYLACIAEDHIERKTDENENPNKHV